MNSKVDFYFSKAAQWQKELEKLRTIVLDCDLTEALKWGVPCYTFQNKNIVLIHAFKEYCALLFFKGSLLKDTDKLLIQQTKNVQAARQIRFTALPEITKRSRVLKAYIYEAVEVEKKGLTVPMKKVSEYSVAEEFQRKLDKESRLKAAFHALTPGRQRGYLLYFSSAKLAKTRESRVEKSIPRILKGRGMED